VGTLSEEKKGSRYWPTIVDLPTAIMASNQGVWAAIIVAVVTAFIASIALFTSSSIGEFDAFSYFDAIMFGIIAIGIRLRFRGFAVAGLVLFIIEKIFQFAQGSFSILGLFIAAFIFIMFVTGIRGTFAVHRFKNQLPEREGEPA